MHVLVLEMQCPGSSSGSCLGPKNERGLCSKGLFQHNGRPLAQLRVLIFLEQREFVARAPFSTIQQDHTRKLRPCILLPLSIAFPESPVETWSGTTSGGPFNPSSSGINNLRRRRNRQNPPHKRRNDLDLCVGLPHKSIAALQSPQTLLTS